MFCSPGFFEIIHPASIIWTIRWGIKVANVSRKRSDDSNLSTTTVASILYNQCTRYIT